MQSKQVQSAKWFTRTNKIYENYISWERIFPGSLDFVSILNDHDKIMEEFVTRLCRERGKSSWVLPWLKISPLIFLTLKENYFPVKLNTCLWIYEVIFNLDRAGRWWPGRSSNEVGGLRGRGSQQGLKQMGF